MANLIDKIIGYVSPERGARRQAFRQYSRQMADMGALGGYHGANRTRTDTGWLTGSSLTGQTHAERVALKALRDRSRHVDRNNAIGHGMLNRIVDNVVGQGMTLQAKTGDEAFDREAEERWNEWWTGQADIRGMLSGPEIERHVQRSHERDGDVGLVLVDRGGRSRVQIVEANQIATPDRRAGDATVLDGVQVNAVGRPVAFHILNAQEGKKRTFTAVPARNFVYYPRLKRANAVRGEPCFTQVLPLLSQIDGYIDAVVIASRMAAIFGLLFKESNAPQAFSGLNTLANTKGDQQKAVTLENGLIKYIGQEDDVVQVQANQPMQQTPNFIAAMLRLVGLPMDLPLELVMLDFSRTNFSSARTAFLNFYRAMRPKQDCFRMRVMGRIYPWWLSRELKMGRFTTPTPELFFNHEFMPRGWQWVDPVKEGQAALLEVSMGTNTRRNVAASQGRDWNEIQAQLAAEAAINRAMGLPTLLSTMTRDP